MTSPEVSLAEKTIPRAYGRKRTLNERRKKTPNSFFLPRALSLAHPMEEREVALDPADLAVNPDFTSSPLCGHGWAFNIRALPSV